MSFSRIAIINDDKDTGRMFEYMSDIPQDIFKSYDCIMSIREKGNIELFHVNEIVDLEETFFFIRMKASLYNRKPKNDHHFLSLLSRLLYIRNIDHNSPVYRHHSDYSEKIHQMLIFSENNIPHPDSIVCRYNSYIKNKETVLSRISFPCVLKTSGMKGSAVWKIDSQKELEDRLRTIKKLAVIQEYIPNTSDFRVMVFDKEIFGAQEKRSTDGFYNNISKGGEADPAAITDEEKDISICAARVSDNLLSGVDFVRSDRGPLVFEVNRYPGISSFEKTTGIEVCKIMAEKIKKKFFNV